MTFHETVTPTRGDLAIAYAKRGLHVFPLRVNEVEPGTRSGAKAATTDERTLRQWWAQRDWNIGVATAPSKIVAVECLGVARPTKRFQADDFTAPVEVPDHEVILTNGMTRLLDMLFEYEEGFPQTHATGLPNGGVSFWFSAEFYRIVPSAEIDDLVHVIGLEEDSYVVAPGSVVNGFMYDVGEHAWHFEELPAWVVAAARGGGG